MKILMFTPFAARNGAEMLLIYIMRNLNKSHFELSLFSLNNGTLLSDVPNYVPIYIQNHIPRRKTLNQHWKKLKGEPTVSSLEQDIMNVHTSFKPEIWYINTILCPEVVLIAKKHSIPYIVHFHELLFLYQHNTYDNMKMMVQNAKLLIGCSKRVCENLHIMGGSNIFLQYECVDFSNIKININNVDKIRLKLNINDSYVWVMSGSIEYRKGTDIVTKIAKHFGKKIMIIWLGLGSSGYSFYIEQEIKYLGLTNVMLLGGKTNDYYDYLSVADGLILTSREDPFPLVMIEAGFLGKPIVAFDSGGVKEFVIDKTGIVVDNNNIEAFIKAMELVMDNKINFRKEIAIERALEFDAKKQVSLLEKKLLQL